MREPSVAGAVAQLGERELCKLEVRGSSPLSSTRLMRPTGTLGRIAQLVRAHP